MEFYTNTSPSEFGSDCFNSQRDGILQIEFSFLNPFLFVSIPNGMEFYSQQKNWQEAGIRGFNSQRDGILLNIENGVA